MSRLAVREFLKGFRYLLLTISIVAVALVGANVVAPVPQDKARPLYSMSEAEEEKSEQNAIYKWEEPILPWERPLRGWWPWI
jgi:hypothetical protein